MTARSIANVFVAACLLGSAGVAHAQDSEVRRAFRSLVAAAPDERFDAGVALSEYGDRVLEVLPDLAASIEHAEADLAVHAAIVTARLGSKAAGVAAAPVLRRLRDADRPGKLSYELIRAAISLEVEPTKLAAAVERHFGDVDRSRTAGLDWASSIFDADPDGRWAVPLIAAVLQGDDWLARRSALDDVWRYGAVAAPLAPRFLDAVRRLYPVGKDPVEPLSDGYRRLGDDWKRGDPSSKPSRKDSFHLAERAALDCRCVYLRALIDLAPHAGTMAPELEALAESGPSAVRADALRALGAVDAGGAVAVRSALRMLGDRLPPRRLAALDVLASRPEPDGARSVLLGLLPRARPYEIRAVADILARWDVAAYGAESRPTDPAVLLQAARSAGAGSADAVRRLGAGGLADSDIEPAVSEELIRRAKGDVGWMSLLAIDAIGRRGVASEAAVEALLDMVRGRSQKEFDLWPDARAAFAWTALGRLRATNPLLLDAARVELSADRFRFYYSAALSCLDRGIVLRAAMIAAPPPFPVLETRRADGLRASPGWLTDWYQQHPDRIVVDWMVPDAAGGFLLQLGEGGPGDGWFHRESDPFRATFLVRLARDEKGAVTVAVGDEKDAAEWFLGPRGGPFPTPYFGEAWVSGAAGESERLAITLSVKMPSSQGEQPSQRWRCAVELADPWRRSAAGK